MQRLKQYLWDAKHMATCSCRLRYEDYWKLKALCELHGTTVHAVIRHMVGKVLINCGVDVTPGLKYEIEHARNVIFKR